MRVAVFSATGFFKSFFAAANASEGHELVYFAESLAIDNLHLAADFPVICCFITDDLSAPVLAKLAELGVQLIALRMVGYDHVDVVAAQQHHLTVVNAPTYSPTAVAEMAVLLMLALLRKFVITQQQVAHNNFSLKNVLGAGVNGRTVGVIGTGNIGTAFANIMRGFGCTVLAHDPFPSEECKQLGVQYGALDEVLSQSDFVSLHCPLLPATTNLIDANALACMKSGAMLINTARGAIVDTTAVISALESKHLGGYGMDVYVKEKDVFFIDHAGRAIDDQSFVRLQQMPNVIITPHQGFFTEEALTNIATMTLQNITAFANGQPQNEITGH